MVIYSLDTPLVEVIDCVLQSAMDQTVRHDMLKFSFVIPYHFHSEFTGIFLIVAVLPILITCTSARITTSDIRASDPATRLAAIRVIDENPDPSAIPDLIAALDSDDPAVRLMSIGTLRKITGKSFNYHFDASPTERNQAVSAWVEAWENNTISYAQHGAPKP